jgi:hypothetical protein
VNELRRKVLALLDSGLPREVLAEVLLDVIARALQRAGGRPSRLEEANGAHQQYINPDVSPDAGQTSKTSDISSLDPISSGSGSPSPKAPKPSGSDARVEPEPPGFIEFWGLYPRRVGKASARRAWKRAKPPMAKVRETLAWQVKAAGWQDLSYVPHPATWINGGRWDDAPGSLPAPKPRNGLTPPPQEIF